MWTRWRASNTRTQKEENRWTTEWNLRDGREAFEGCPGKWRGRCGPGGEHQTQEQQAEQPETEGGDSTCSSCGGRHKGGEGKACTYIRTAEAGTNHPEPGQHHGPTEESQDQSGDGHHWQV